MAKDRLRDRQRSLQRRLESLLLPADGERARADSLDSSQLSEPSEEGKEGERKNEGGQGGRAAKGLTWPSPVPRGCRGRGGWCGVRRGPAARLWHREGPQLLQPPQPRLLTAPAAFPALPARLLPAGNPAPASLSTAARLRGHRWGQESGLTPPQPGGTGCDTALWHPLCTTRHWKRCWKKAQLSLRTLSASPCAPTGSLGAA